jgi:hypothetical protein
MHCLRRQKLFLFVRIGIGILFGCVVFCLHADAQVSEARLTGVVTDASGAIVPGAQISISNASTGTTRDLISNQSGLYNAPGLPAGNYTVKISAPGFDTEVRNGVVLTTGAEQVLNITLKIGNVTQQVVVSDLPPQVQLSTSALSDVVDSTSVRQLPLNGRSWTDLAVLTVGVSAIKTQAPIAASDRPKRGLGAELSISGGRPQQNSYLLDGININDYSNAGPGSILGGNLGVDAIQEFNVITTNSMVQYGRTAGGVISAITRSGTNDFHGSVYDFLRNSALDAKNYFDTVGAIPAFRQNQFGASAGGAIKKNNTFVFGDYEGVRQTLGLTNRPIVPTAAVRTAPVQCIAEDFADGVCAAGQTTHPVDPQATRFLNAFFPVPNVSPGPNAPPSDTGLYAFSSAEVTSENYFTIKVDHTFSDTDNVAVTYMFDDNPSVTPDELKNKNVLAKTRRQLVSILENHIFSPSLQNSVHFGFSRDNAGSPIGATAINPAAADTSFGFAPGDTAGGIVIGGLVAFSGGLTLGAFPNAFRWNSWQAYDDISLTKGIHTFTFGANIERILDNQITSNFPGGIFTFNSLHDFLVNSPFSLQIDKPGFSTPRDVRQTIFGTYFQDDIKYRPNLTVNLGLRYEIASVPEETSGRMSNLRNFSSGNVPFTGSPYFRNNSLSNFEPRIGIAWDPFRNGRTSVRGGFGFYDILPYIVQTGPGLDGTSPFKSTLSGVFPPGSGLFPTGAYKQLSAANNVYLYDIQFNPPRNYVMQWNLNIQRQIRPNTTAMVAYVGSRGLHLWYQTDDGNIVLPIAHTSDGYFWPSNIGSGTKVDPVAGRFSLANWTADAYYHGFEAELLQRLTRGVQAQVSFTWSRCIDTSSGSAASDQYRNSLPATFWPDPRSHRGPCDTNITRNFVANAVWNISHRKNLPGILAWATGGWQASGILTMSSGQPFSVEITGDPMGLNSVIPFAFPDRLRGPGCSQPINQDNPNNYIKLGCFSLPLAPANPPVACTPFSAAPTSGPATCANKMGNAGRNGLVGPGIVNLDFSIYKSNPLKFISETADLQFRAEAYNAFNRPDFAPPNDFFNVFDNTGAPISSAGVIDQTTVTAREIQFALKFTW